MSRSVSKAVVRTESKSLTQHYGENPLKNGRRGDIFSALSECLKVAESCRLDIPNLQSGASF